VTGRLRALIVDDDVAVARIHQRFVAAHPSFTVVGLAHSGASALEQIERLKPDLVLLDVYLPDFSGLEVLSRMRLENGRHVEVIAVTAARDLTSVREARANGVRHYLVTRFPARGWRDRLDEVERHHATLRRTAGGEPLDQRTVDQIIASTASAPALPPKGLSQPTLERVAAVLREADADLSASEIAERIGMSRVGARRYLEHLVGEGLASVAPRYGATGRPENRYRVAH
jgi:response regulator of citrate/malate metabolism